MYLYSLEPPCGIPCPDPTWTLRQWRVLTSVIYGFSIVSFSLMLIAALLYLANPDYRISSRRITIHSVRAGLRGNCGGGGGKESLLTQLFMLVYSTNDVRAELGNRRV